jgi:hypothetical protein
VCSRHAEYGAGYDITDATMDSAQEPAPVYHRGYAHAPEPRAMRYTNTCSACGCGWKVDDLSAPNPIDDMCLEPVKWHPRKCLCHSATWAMTFLDERDRRREDVVVGEV